MTKGLYVHIPFCKGKCAYCNFCSGVFSESTQKQYFQKLWQEINSQSPNHKISSIFFGGGTPTAVNPVFLAKTLNRIKKRFDVLKSAEITLEANPETVTAENLGILKNAGFNRISYGAQSFEDETLKKLGRRHNSLKIFEAVELAKACGFDNVSVDLILGASPLNKLVFENGVNKLLDLGVVHLSVYILMLEEGTLLYQKVKNKDVSIASEEAVAKEYAYVQSFLEKLRLKQYEISNFAKKGYECRHNQNYWERGEYLAFGASAHGFNQNVRWENASDVQKYIALPVSKLAVSSENLGQTDKIVETIMLALRTTMGLNLEHIKNLGFDVLTEKGDEVQNLKNAGLIEIKNGFLRITPKNFVVSNSIILKLIP